MCRPNENCIYWQYLQPYSSMKSVSLESLVTLHNRISTTQLSSDTSKEEIVRILHTSFKVAAHRPLSILLEEAAAMDANDFNVSIDHIVDFFQDLHNGKHNVGNKGAAENIKTEFATSMQYIREQFNQANLEIELDVKGVVDIQSQVLARIIRE